MKIHIDRSSVFIFALILFAAAFAHSQSVTPFMGFGSAQLFDNNGKPLTAGVIYSYQAGTSTQQATFTDFTGTVQNPNPIPLSSGARVAIWLTSSAFYKFVICLQNDGPFCAAADVLVSVDQVPGCPGCSSGNIFTGTFISITPNPATTGILRLSSLDSICWRNNSGTANLCIAKDSSDVLSWSGGALKMPQVFCGAVSNSFDYICASSSSNRWQMSNNGSPYEPFVGISAAGTAGDLATLATNGIDIVDSGIATPLAGTIAVPFSATPSFAATTSNQLFTITLTGNVTSSTLTVPPALGTPALLTFVITEDGSGSRTFAWPTNVIGAFPPNQTANAVTTESFVWDGTNARATVPPSFYPPQRSQLGSNVGLVASTQATILTQAVTFPSQAGAYRADARYVVWVTAGSNVCTAEVIDFTNSRAFAASGQNANGAGYIGLAGSEVSPQTYAPGQVVTFHLDVECNNGGGGLVGVTPSMNGNAIFSMSPNEQTYISITPVLSN